MQEEYRYICGLYILFGSNIAIFSSVIKMLFMETTSNIILSNGKLESFPLSKINSFQFSRLVVSDS